MSNEEQGIAQAQITAAQAQNSKGDGLGKVQEQNIAYLDDRIFMYLGAIAFLGLLVVWATASSALVLYGSLGFAILLTILWGVARVNRIKRLKAERTRQADAMQSINPDDRKYR